jgi:hyperosmotically inducible protein
VFRALFYLLVFFAVIWGLYRYHETNEIPVVGGRVEDATALASVKAALALHRGLTNRPISVRARQGVVTLSGEVASAMDKTAAERLAASSAGIEQIENLMAVNPELAMEKPKEGLSLGQKLDDVSLATKVKAALKLHRDLQGLDLSVRARQGTLYLEGAVETPEQAELARSWALSIDGVEEVVSRLDVTGRPQPADKVADRIEQELADNENLGRYRLSASVRKGIIVLEGRVATGAERELAGLLAERTADGGKVTNQIQLEKR